MPLIRIEAEGDTPTVYRTKAPLGQTLARGLERDGPVMILIHGFKHHPALDFANPHKHIFAYAPQGDFKAVSWPTHLGFGQGHHDEGLCLAFSWPARGRFRDIYGRAAVAGAALADLVANVRAQAPDREIHVVAHSLGARVFLSALGQLPAGAIRRAILLAAAEFTSRAEAGMQSCAGRTTEVINVTSRENDLYDTLFEVLAPSGSWGDWCLGHGLRQTQNNWVDIQIDHPEVMQGLARLGFQIEPGRFQFCHWSTYTRRGLLDFYAHAIRQPDQVTLDVVSRIAQARQQRRWSRVVPLPTIPLPAILPVGRPS